jgi:hypothetical protein
MKRFAAVLALSLVSLDAASKDDARRTFVVRLYDDPGMQKIVDVFRPKGYRVDVIHETAPSKTAAQYTVIEVGSDVPAGEAIEVIRLAHDTMPTLRYVFIHEDPEMTNVIFVGGSTSWISYKNLKPLTDKDFQDICTGEPSQITFHARVRKFGL